MGFRVFRAFVNFGVAIAALGFKRFGLFKGLSVESSEVWSIWGMEAQSTGSANTTKKLEPSIVSHCLVYYSAV